MDAVLDLLLTTPTGLLSLFTILFVIGMGFFLSAWFKRKMSNPEA